MSCSTPVGVTDVDGVHATRWLHRGGDPEQVTPRLPRSLPHRLRRDADGRLLLDGDVPDWSWWLPPVPADRAGR